MNEIVATLFFAGGVVFTAVTSSELFRADRHLQTNPVLAFAAIYGFFGVWLVFFWRKMWVGLYTNPDSLRVRWVQRTRTVPWVEIARVDVLGAPQMRDGIWLTLRDGERIETPIHRLCRRQDVTRLQPTGVGGPAWESAAHDRDVGPSLPSREFDRVVSELRAHLTPTGRQGSPAPDDAPAYTATVPGQ